MGGLLYHQIVLLLTHSFTLYFSYYDNFLEGEFVLYENVEQDIAVHTFYRACGQASCNCAVSVRAGDDVYVVDRCGPNMALQTEYPLTVRTYQNGRMTPDFHIIRKASGLTYEVGIK